MKIHEIINEDVNSNLVYHGVTSGQKAERILRSGVLFLTEPFDFDAEEEGGTETRNHLSVTRNQYLRFPYGNGVVQFVIDKDALKRGGWQVQPKIGTGMHYKYETEERVYHKLDKSIPVRPPYVVGIQVYPGINIPQDVIEKTKSLGIPITPMKLEKRPDPTAPKPIRGSSYGPPGSFVIDIQKTDKGYTVSSRYTSAGMPQGLDPIEPYINIPDKETAIKIKNKLQDMVDAGLNYKDLSPPQYHRNWEQGRHNLSASDKEFKWPKI